MRFSGLVPLVAAALAAMVAGCSSAADAEPADQEHDIQGGAPDFVDPSVGLVMQTDGALCTGTLIAPDVVLTAAHCTFPPVASFSIGSGAPLSEPGIPMGMWTYATATTIAHPTYAGLAKDGAIGTDLALVRLQQPLAILPAAVADAPPLPGTACRAIGFGRHDEGGTRWFAQKRAGSVVASLITDSSIIVQRLDAMTDHGDSGGPLFCNGTVAGALSWGWYAPDGGRATHSSYVRVDAVRPWIDAVTATWRMLPVQ